MSFPFRAANGLCGWRREKVWRIRIGREQRLGASGTLAGRRPGTHRIRVNTKILRADLHRRRRAHRNCREPENILAGKDQDVPLEPDDILFVPGSKPKAAIFRGLEAAFQVGTEWPPIEPEIELMNRFASSSGPTPTTARQTVELVSRPYLDAPANPAAAKETEGLIIYWQILAACTGSSSAECWESCRGPVHGSANARLPGPGLIEIQGMNDDFLNFKYSTRLSSYSTIPNTRCRPRSRRCRAAARSNVWSRS